MKKLIKEHPSTNDIIKAILEFHDKNHEQYDGMSQVWMPVQGLLLETCRDIFQFATNNILFEIEPDTDQTVKSLDALLRTGKGDSKHFAMFYAGMLCAMKRSGDERIESVVYRFGSADKKKDIHHVFIIVNDTIFLDACRPFNDHNYIFETQIDFEVK